MSSISTPILTDERPPLGADGPLQRIENPRNLSTDWSRENITIDHKRMPHGRNGGLPLRYDFSDLASIGYVSLITERALELRQWTDAQFTFTTGPRSSVSAFMRDGELRSIDSGKYCGFPSLETIPTQ
jgi:hypothetical protein